MFALAVTLLMAPMAQGGLTDPPLVNHSFEDPVLDAGVQSDDINDWWDALQYTYTQDEATADYPFTPYGDNWAELGNGRWIYQQIGTYEENMDLDISFLVGQRDSKEADGVTVDLFAGGNPALAADVNAKRDAAGFPLDSVVGAVQIATTGLLTPFSGVTGTATAEMFVQLSTGTAGAGYAVGDPLWVVLSRPSTNGRLLIDNVSVRWPGGEGKPVVNAGPDQTTVLPDNTVTLDAEIKDNGDPNEVLTYWWEVTSKPAGATCDLDTGLGPFTITVKESGDVEPNEPYALTPIVTVSQAGVYELTLTARDQAKDANDVVKVTALPEGYLGLVAHWNLDEGAGTVAQDAAGNFYDPNDDTLGFDRLDCPGVLLSGNGGPDPNWIDGPDWQNTDLLAEPDDFLEAIWLDDDYQQYMAIRNLHYEDSGLEECTVTAWIKTGSGDNQVIASFDRNEYWRLEVNGPAAGFGQVGWGPTTSTGAVLVSSVNRVDDDKWHHVAGVFDNGEVIIYLDGVKEDSATGGSTFGTGTLRYGFIGVGSEATEYDGDKSPLDYFHGGIDDVQIYNVALTQLEILDVARIGNTAPLADAGPDQRLIQALEGDAIVLSGASVTDVPNNVDVVWTATGPGAVFFSGNPVNATATFDGSSFGLYELTITATDQAEPTWVSSDTVYIMYQEKALYSTGGKGDPMALWKLDGPEAGDPNLVLDSTVNALNGVIVGDPNVPEWQPGQGKVTGGNQGALFFTNDGQDDNQYVDLRHVPGPNDLTVMLWAKLSKSTTNQYLIDKLPAGNGGVGWAIQLQNSSDNIRFRVGSDGDSTNIAGDFTYDVWNHVAASFDSQTGEMKLFVNGLRVDDDIATQRINSDDIIAVPLNMGKPSTADVGDEVRGGSLDHVRLYDIVLSDFEIAQIAIEDMVEMDSCYPDRFPAEQAIPGDISGPEGVPDCRVDLFDVAVLANSWLVDANLY
jgi:hypothetical protein